MIEYLPDFMAEWGLAEGGFIIALLTYLGIDFGSGWRGARWVFRGFKPEQELPKPVKIVSEAPKPYAAPPAPDAPRQVVGREDALKELEEKLKGDSGVAITGKTVVQGRGGLGKTTLAKEFMRRNKDRYDVSLWVEADTRANAANAILADLCPQLGRDMPAVQSPEAARQEMSVLSSSGKTALVVFDNVDDYAEVDSLIPQGDKIDLIITTRTHGGYPGYQQLALGVLDYDTIAGEAVTLLMQEAGTDEDAKGARELAEALGGLPLALVTAGRLIREEDGSFADYQTRLEDILRDKPPQGDDYPDSIRAATVMSYEKLSDDAKMVADIFAWWAPEGLTAGLISDAPSGQFWSYFVSDVPEQLVELAQDAPRVGRAVKELARLSLIEAEAQGSFAMHRLTGHSLRLGQAGDENAAAAALLMAQYPGGDSPPSLVTNWPICRALTPHARAIWGSGQAPQTAAMYTLMNQCGLFLSRQDDLESTIAWYRAALALSESLFEEDSRDIPLALGNLAQELAKLPDKPARGEAIEKITRAIELDEEHRPGSEDLAAKYMQAANIHYRLALAGEDDQITPGLSRVAQAKPIRLDLFGPDHEMMAHCYSVEAVLHSLNKDMPSAIAADEKVLAIWRKGDRGVLAASLNNLGSRYLQVGAADRAVPLLQESYDIRSEIYAEVPDHSDLRGTAQWLATALLVQARAGKNPELRMMEAKKICLDHDLSFEKHKHDAEHCPLDPTIDLPDLG